MDRVVEPHYGCIDEEVLDQIECEYCGRTLKQEYYGQKICFVCEEELDRFLSVNL
jgi:hypothetical protein